jgi:hypothetical protein
LFDNGDQPMKPGTERAFGRAQTPVFIIPGSAISTQHLPTNVLPRAGLKHQIEETGTIGVFGIWKSGFMSVFKIGRRYGLFLGGGQAAELTSLAEYVLLTPFQARQQFAATAPKRSSRSVPPWSPLSAIAEIFCKISQMTAYWPMKPTNGADHSETGKS